MRVTMRANRFLNAGPMMAIHAVADAWNAVAVAWMDAKAWADVVAARRLIESRSLEAAVIAYGKYVKSLGIDMTMIQTSEQYRKARTEFSQEMGIDINEVPAEVRVEVEAEMREARRSFEAAMSAEIAMNNCLAAAHAAVEEVKEAELSLGDLTDSFELPASTDDNNAKVERAQSAAKNFEDRAWALRRVGEQAADWARAAEPGGERMRATIETATMGSREAGEWARHANAMADAYAASAMAADAYRRALLAAHHR